MDVYRKNTYTLSMIGTYIMITLGTLLVYNVWIRILRQITKHYTAKIRIHAILIGIIGSVTILGGPILLQYLGLQGNFTEHVTYGTLSGYIGYITICSIAFFVIYTQKIETTYIKYILMFVVLMGNIARGIAQEIPAYLIYFSIVGMGEEFVKYNLGFSLFKKFQLHYTDIILFCIISGIGFSLIENIVYGIESIGNNDITGLVTGGKTIIQRGIINVGLHGIFTGIIGYFALSETGQFHIKSSIGICIAIALHLCFNIIAYQQIALLIPIFVLGGYIALTFFFYNSDTLYRKLTKET